MANRGCNTLKTDVNATVYKMVVESLESLVIKRVIMQFCLGKQTMKVLSPQGGNRVYIKNSQYKYWNSWVSIASRLMSVYTHRDHEIIVL